VQNAMLEDHAVADVSLKLITCSEAVFSGAEARSIGPNSTRLEASRPRMRFGRTSVGSVQKKAPPVPGRFRPLAVREAQSLEFLDSAVTRGDRNPEPAAQVDRGRRAVERSQDDACGILVHDRLGHLQGFHGSHSRLSERMRATRPVISSASNGLFRCPIAPRRTLSISVKVSPNAVMRIARIPGFPRRGGAVSSTPFRPRMRV